MSTSSPDSSQSSRPLPPEGYAEESFSKGAEDYVDDPTVDHDEEHAGGRVPPPHRRRGIYLLPNLLTTGALFGGFYAILSAMSGRFEAAAVAIFVAMLFDGLDGRVARMTNTQSAFGVQYDSLSDMVSFGVAPAILAYSWAVHELGKLGWAAAFIYASCAALRLARFNTMVGLVDKRYFIGLASPAAAAVVAGMVWTGSRLEPGIGLAIIAGVVTSIVGILMVSNIRYNSFKDLDLRGRVPFVAMLAIAMGFVVIMTDPPRMLFLLALGYAVSGPVLELLRRVRRDRAGATRS